MSFRLAYAPGKKILKVMMKLQSVEDDIGSVEEASAEEAEKVTDNR